MISMEGKLVILEPLDIAKHAEGYFAVSQDEKVHAYVGNTVPETLEDVIKLLQVYETHFLNWMILEKDTRQVIGLLRISKPQCENGILSAGESQRLASRYWRKGHMKEAKRLLYPYIFGELAVDVLYADVWEENVNSWKSLEYYGYKRMESKMEFFSKTGTAQNRFYYALSKEDYFQHTN